MTKQSEHRNDRLGQIWGKFEGKTSRHLTGKGIDNIPRPELDGEHRRKDIITYAHEVTSRPLPKGVEDPAKVAMAALRGRLTSYDGKTRKRKTKKSAEPELTTPDFSIVDEQLFRDLAATEKRITRREGDYKKWLVDQEANGKGRKRRKFFGIF